jgi:hypothetical protein
MFWGQETGASISAELRSSLLATIQRYHTYVGLKVS